MLNFVRTISVLTALSTGLASLPAQAHFSQLSCDYEASNLARLDREAYEAWRRGETPSISAHRECDGGEGRKLIQLLTYVPEESGKLRREIKTLEPVDHLGRNVAVGAAGVLAAGAAGYLGYRLLAVYKSVKAREARAAAAAAFRRELAQAPRERRARNLNIPQGRGSIAVAGAISEKQVPPTAARFRDAKNRTYVTQVDPGTENLVLLQVLPDLPEMIFFTGSYWQRNVNQPFRFLSPHRVNEAAPHSGALVDESVRFRGFEERPYDGTLAPLTNDDALWTARPGAEISTSVRDFRVVKEESRVIEAPEIREGVSVRESTPAPAAEPAPARGEFETSSRGGSGSGGGWGSSGEKPSHSSTGWGGGGSANDILPNSGPSPTNFESLLGVIGGGAAAGGVLSAPATGPAPGAQ